MESNKPLTTIVKMAKELKRLPNTVKKQLIAKGIKPVEYFGPTGMYVATVIEEIRDIPSVGRPKRKHDEQTPPKPKKRSKPQPTKKAKSIKTKK